MVAAGIVLALIAVHLDGIGAVPGWLVHSPWLYNGAATGARTLLGAIASSTIGVAGTVFSITIAAISLAAGQMGPRLLRNFTRDRGNQFTLGTFLGTFSYALMVLRSVRAPSEGEFVPHLSLSIGILLAFVCVGVLVFFVGHMAGRINVDTVVHLVSEDVHRAITRLMLQEPAPPPPPDHLWAQADAVTDRRRGYLLQLDEGGLADWAAAHGTSIRMLVRPGSYVFPGAPIALLAPMVEGADAAIVDATALGEQQGSSADLEFTLRQLVEVAVRALSPGINDPHTAMSVLNLLGAALCGAAQLHLATGVSLRDGRPVLVVPAIAYGGLVDVMFHMIRQNAAGSAAVLIRELEVLTSVVLCEPDPARRRELRRHADLVLDDAARDIPNRADLDELRGRHLQFLAVVAGGAAALVGRPG